MGIRLTALSTISSGAMLFMPENILTFNRHSTYRLLNETVKQQTTRARSSAIKTKHKFIQIVIQMRRQWSALMRSLKPTFQQRRYTISQRQQIFPNVSRFTNNFTMITSRRQTNISIPIIRAHFTARFYTLFNRWYQTLSRSIFNFMQTNSPSMLILIFNGHNNQDLIGSTSATFSRTRS